MTEDLKKRGGREGPSDIPGGPGQHTDWVVFGVTAAITLAFVIWGSVGHRLPEERLRQRCSAA